MEIKTIIVEGPSCPQKEAVIQKLKELTHWEVMAPETPWHTSEDFVQAYHHAYHKILTSSHIGYAAERQYQWGLHPFTHAEKKELDHACQENTLIVLIQPRTTELIWDSFPWDTKIKKESAINSLLLHYWKEIEEVNHLIWEKESQNNITQQLAHTVK